MKIDTTQIPSFDTLPDDVKNAILAMEFADAPDMSQFVSKTVFDRKASEAADLSKQLKARMTEEEAKAAKEAEERAALETRVKELELEHAIGVNTNKYLALGFDEKLARASAKALANGDMDTVFNNMKSHIETREKALRTEILQQTPRPAAGGEEPGMNKDAFSKMSLAEKQKFAAENPEAYASFYN